MSLSVIQRLRAVAKLHYSENPGVALTISKLCSLARVNRANAYQRHRELLKELTKQKVQQKNTIQKTKKIMPSDNNINIYNKELEKKYKALMNLCLEQMAEIRFLKTQVQYLKIKK